MDSDKAEEKGKLGFCDFWPMALQKDDDEYDTMVKVS